MTVLYDIMEPEEVESTQVAVGIDFGTTNSLVAIVKEGKCLVIPDEKGLKLLPSIVAYHNGDAIVGAKALDYDNPIHSIKRFLGRNIANERIKEELSTNTAGRLNINGLNKLDIEVAADIFKALKSRADKFLNFDVRNAVITVPAYFDDAERHAVKAAAQLADFNVLRLINEPTAAAYAYGLEESLEGLFLVYDLGGGTFDISILHMQRGVFEVIATGGDNQLGGDDLDQALCKFLCKQQGLELEKLKAAQLRDLLFAARTVKQHLSTHDNWQGHYGESLASVTREQFEELIKPYIDRTMNILDRVMSQTNIEKNKVNKLLLVGGSTRIPYIKSLLAKSFTVLDNIDPEQIVVQGAAQKAYALSEGEGGLLIDVTPLSLGIELADGINEVLIPRNSPIPAQHKHIFTTSKDGQTGFVIHVLQGEGEMAHQCRSLAKFHLQNLPALPAGIVRLELNFQIDADGILTVKAHELTSGLKQQVLVKPSYGLSEEELLKLLTKA